MTTDWSSEFAQREGILSQGAEPWGEVACVAVRGRSLLLSPVSRHQGPPLAPGVQTFFQVASPAGFVRVPGTLLGIREIVVDGVTREVLQLDADPEGVERVNRRAHYRVAVALKGEVAFVAGGDARGRPRAPTHLEALSQAVARGRRPCLMRDLGLGGALLFTQPPVPVPHTGFLLDLALGPEEKLRNLSGHVVEAHMASDASGFSVRVRVHFDRLSGAADAQLSRYVAHVQMQLLKKGIRG